MAKRQKESGLVDGLYEIASVLPWWLDVSVAGGSFVGFRRLVETNPQLRPRQPTRDI